MNGNHDYDERGWESALCAHQLCVVAITPSAHPHINPTTTNKKVGVQKEQNLAFSNRNIFQTSPIPYPASKRTTSVGETHTHRKLVLSKKKNAQNTEFKVWRKVSLSKSGPMVCINDYSLWEQI